MNALSDRADDPGSPEDFLEQHHHWTSHQEEHTRHSKTQDERVPRQLSNHCQMLLSDFKKSTG
jgi:hypothetical protein